ncbi:LysR substrate-binding domain-containing protein, partial [Streptomyces sp. NPDC006386]|uniref:LysR substrate-binding domain-containing protein n=1 Tax=Streptomyces sp. NPDC006386 TaxID=3156762 RepID=UPI0033AF793E
IVLACIVLAVAAGLALWSRAWATGVCHAAGFEPDVAYVSADMLVHARLVEEGHAAAFLPDMLGSDRTPGLFLDGSAGHVRTVLATVRAGAGEHPLIQAFLTAIRHAIGEPAAGAGGRRRGDTPDLTAP